MIKLVSKSDTAARFHVTADNGPQAASGTLTVAVKASLHDGDGFVLDDGRGHSQAFECAVSVAPEAYTPIHDGIVIDIHGADDSAVAVGGAVATYLTEHTDVALEVALSGDVLTLTNTSSLHGDFENVTIATFGTGIVAVGMTGGDSGTQQLALSAMIAYEGILTARLGQYLAALKPVGCDWGSPWYDDGLAGNTRLQVTVVHDGHNRCPDGTSVNGSVVTTPKLDIDGNPIRDPDGNILTNPVEPCLEVLAAGACDFTFEMRLFD